MSRPEPQKRRRTLFVGGPGRSGTSFVANRMGRHPSICSFPDVELKLFTEKSGLLDLYLSLVEHYSPNRASVALDQFRRLADSLIEGRYGQPALNKYGRAETWHQIFQAFSGSLTRDSHPIRQDEADFLEKCRGLLVALGEQAALQNNPQAIVFLEKTPHALLEVDFLAKIDPEAMFLHVMRDPRSIAHSLLKMRWAPDDPAACCTWVESYCMAWTSTKERALQVGIEIEDTAIEAIADDPTRQAMKLLSFSAIGPEQGLFDGASAKILNGWVKKCDVAVKQLLQDRLSQWAQRFGYCKAEIGALEDTASSSRCEVATEPGQYLSII